MSTMATPYTTNLVTARDQLSRTLADVTSFPAPNYSINGTSISWSEYVTQLTQQIEKLNELIQISQSPFWKTSKAKA